MIGITLLNNLFICINLFIILLYLFINFKALLFMMRNVCIGYCPIGMTKILSKDLPKLEKSNYLTIEALEDGLTVSFTNPLEYSLDSKTWQSLPSNTQTPAIDKGQYVAFRAKLTPLVYSGIGTFSVDKQCNLKGNCMSLLFGADFNNKIDLTGYDYAFYNLFSNQSKIISVDAKFLPATTLADYCYSGIFSGCTSLTTAPELPAIALADHCYSYMFSSCSSLITAPELPATILAASCYENMFSYCESLTTTPSVLPATTLADNCYYYMFYYCTSVTTVPKLPATTLTSLCYGNMFYYCTSLTTAPELPATTLANNCYESMFSNCASLTTAPKLPATELAEYCYSNMFYSCYNLTTAPELPATTLVGSCYRGMFSSCSSLTTAPVLPATTLVFGCYDSMFYDCYNLAHIKALFTTTPDSSYTDEWVSNVSPTGTFVKSKDATWNVTGVYGIPEGWTIEVA